MEGVLEDIMEVFGLWVKKKLYLHMQDASCTGLPIEIELKLQHKFN